MRKSTFINVRVDPTTKQLKPVTELDRIQLEMFLKQYDEDSDFQLMLTLHNESKTSPQLAKVHAGIKDIAEFSGMTFMEVKNHIKHEASLIEFNGEEAYLKSFTNCSKAELDTAIKVMERFAANIGCVLSF